MYVTSPFLIQYKFQDIHKSLHSNFVHEQIFIHEKTPVGLEWLIKSGPGLAFKVRIRYVSELQAVWSWWVLLWF